MNKRIPKDVAMAMDGSLASQGIFYHAADADMTRGWAMIVGPDDTPYAGGLFFFRLELPPEYPFAPPKVQFCTYDGETRFHPNLYKEGKVCLSILGTWAGPSWAATMNLTTVLVTIQSLLHVNPIICEPSYSKMLVTDPRSVDYSDFVSYRVVRYTLAAYGGSVTGEFGDIFKDAMLAVRPIVFERIGKVIEKNKGVVKSYSGLFYSLGGVCDWPALASALV
jgi:ubiquitin-protein ligase